MQPKDDPPLPAGLSSNRYDRPYRHFVVGGISQGQANLPARPAVPPQESSSAGPAAKGVPAAGPASAAKGPGQSLPFSFGPDAGRPSFSQLLREIESGKVGSLELAPRQRVVTATYRDARTVQVPVLPDNQLLLRTAAQARVPLTVRDERQDDAMAGLLSNGLLVLLLVVGLSLLVRRSAQVANKTLGFGRSHIGPLISRFAQQYPQVDVQLQLSVDPPSLSDDAFDVCIRFGPPPDARVIARKIASNQRLLCASPAYIARHGEPKTTADLARHNFISIRQGGEAYGVIKLTRGRAGKTETLKTRGNLTTNDGGIAVQWALDGHGILMRAEWDIRPHLAQGQLVQLLLQFRTPDADIYAVYPAQHKSTARVRAFVEFVAEAFKGTEAPGI